MQLLIGLLILAAAVIAVLAYRESARSERLRERLSIDEQPEGVADGSLWRDAADLLQIEQLQALLERSPLTRQFAERLVRSNLPLSLGRALFVVVVSTSVAVALALVLQRSVWLPIAVLVAVPLLLWLALDAYADQRMQRIDRQLPAFVAQMLSALRSGGTPLSSLQTAARISPQPLGGTLQALLDALQLGVSPAQAWRDWAIRCGGSHCELLATGVRLKWEAGGQMTSMLEHILESMQSRERMILRVRTLTAQARLGGYVLTALPLLFLLFTYYRNPSIFNFVLNDPVGVKALWAGGALLVVGFFWLRRLARLDV